MFSKLLPQAQSISYFWRKFSFVLLFLLSVLALLGLIVAGYDTLAPIYGDNIRRAIMGASGLLFGLFMTWQCILGVRPMSSAWVKDFFRVNGWHKWLGIGTLTLLILHPVAVMFDYSQARLYVLLPDFSSAFETWISFGRIALMLTFVILFTSILSRKWISFRK